MDQKLKHLEFIQGVINRLSTNSFLLKGWSVVLVSALFALSAHNSSVKFILLSYFPAIIFWGLDGYFLNLERKYRVLYDDVRNKDPNNIDFSMDIKDINKGLNGWAEATFSRSLIPFHGVLILSIILIMIIQN
jgi:hypothetical protein